MNEKRILNCRNFYKNCLLDKKAARHGGFYAIVGDNKKQITNKYGKTMEWVYDVCARAAFPYRGAGADFYAYCLPLRWYEIMLFLRKARKNQSQTQNI